MQTIHRKPPQSSSLDIFSLRLHLPADIRHYIVDAYLGPIDDKLIMRVYSLLWNTRGFHVQYLDEKTYERLSREWLHRWYTPFMHDPEFGALRVEYLHSRVRPSGKGRLYDLEYRTERERILSNFFAQQPFDDCLRLQLNPTVTFSALRLLLKERKEQPLFSTFERKLGEQFLLHCLSETVYFVRESLVPELRRILPRFQAWRALRSLHLTDTGRSEEYNKLLLVRDSEDLDAQIRAFNKYVVQGSCPLTTHPVLADQLLTTLPSRSYKKAVQK